MKLQTIACAVAIATGGLFFSHTMNEARAATNTLLFLSRSSQRRAGLGGSSTGNFS